MSTPKWDEEMKLDLLRLKSELKPDSFRALSTPIGLGKIKLKPVIEERSRLPHLQLNPESLQKTKAPILDLGVQKAPNWAPIYAEPMGLGQKLLRFVLAHCLDLAFVMLTIGLGISLMGWVIDPEHMSFDTAMLNQASPFVLLKKLQLFAAITGIYSVFVIYWTFFKIVTGATLGENWLNVMWRYIMTSRSARIKVSSDS